MKKSENEPAVQRFAFAQKFINGGVNICNRYLSVNGDNWSNRVLENQEIRNIRKFKGLQRAN